LVQKNNKNVKKFFAKVEKSQKYKSENVLETYATNFINTQARTANFRWGKA